MSKRPIPLERTTFRRLLHLHGQLVGCVILGAVAVALAPPDWRLATRLLAGWDFGIGCYLALTLVRVMPAEVENIRRRAELEDEGAALVLLLTVGAASASLAANIVFLGGSGEHVGALGLAFTLATIILSWLFMHTIFALHYAHEYYGGRSDNRIGGLKFPGNAGPDYWDFLYFSAIIAMTSQVSDVAITSKTIRRLATAHGVLSFFYNLVILALTVSILAGVIGGQK